MSNLRAILGALRIAVGSVRANPARGILTALGIVIGIVAVVTTMTAANGLANSFRESVATSRFGRTLRFPNTKGHDRQFL